MKKENSTNKYNFYRETPYTELKPGGSFIISFLPAIVLGFSTLVVQIILMRIFLSVFYGNELVIGIILSNWMILTGAGAYMGRLSNRIGNKFNFTIWGIAAIGILPFITAFLISYLKNIIYPVGSMVSIIQIYYNSFFLLLPFCTLSGFMFTHLSSLVSQMNRNNSIAKIYYLEAAGSIIGGVIFNIFLIFILDSFQNLIVVMAANLVVSVLLIFNFMGKLKGFIWGFTSLAVILFCLVINADLLTKEFLFPGEEIEYYEDSPYGSIVITEQGNQKNFYENNILSYSTDEIEANEEVIHYAVIQHPAPKKIFLISGGISGILDEILKYDVDLIDYAELNPAILDAGKRFITLPDNSIINIVNKDARLFLNETEQKYDVVIVNLPPPTTAQLNRYYTTEFYDLLKKRLTPGGVVSISTLTSTDYLSMEGVEINSILLNTLQHSFKNVLIIPGYKIYFAASDNSLTINIAEKIDERGIDNLFVNRFYIDDDRLKERSDNIMNSLSKHAKMNEDFNPVAYYSQLIYWLSYFRFNYWVIPVVIILGILLIIRKFNVISFGILAGGFAATSIEVLLLLSFQIIYGYVYQMLGVIITIFFTGLACGTYYFQKYVKGIGIEKFIITQLGIGVYSILLPLLILFMQAMEVSVFLVHFIFIILTFIISFMIGVEFTLAVKIKKGNIHTVAAEIYGYDLLGSALGALIVSIYLIPLIGIAWSGIFIGLLNITAAVITMINKKKYAP